MISRIWGHDFTVWAESPDEITNRLGWLHSPQWVLEHQHRLDALSMSLRSEGYTHAVLLGMGGSSLAPELFAKVYESNESDLQLEVLDSTDPDAVRALTERIDPASTLFFVSSKSGSTVETLSFFKHFYNQVVDCVGAEKAGEHFVTITDPGSKLVDLARRYDFRAVFENDPNIGGRYSALTYFGLVPAAVAGVDVPRLLDRAGHAAAACDSCVRPEDNPAAVLGVVMSELASLGRNKLTILTSDQIAPFGDWVEQLIAESTGKDGKGIVPIVGEPLGSPEIYGVDRLFVQIKLEGDESLDELLAELENLGHPIIRISLHDVYDLGGQFFHWEMATSVAGQRLAIQPFDQPNVEAAKILARENVEAFHQSGALPSLRPTFTDNGMSIFASSKSETAAEALQKLVDESGTGGYLVILAFIPPDEANTQRLTSIRRKIRDGSQKATMFGYGPRYLHSTGQLHKGDDGSGSFIIFTNQSSIDLPIPDEAGRAESAMGFGVLKMAQALGDEKALKENDRKVIRIHFKEDVLQQLSLLDEALS